MQAGSPLDTFAPGLFSGKTALITGGGRGIGQSIAEAFARLGANVVIASRREENLLPAAAKIRALGASCLAVPMNIRNTSEVEDLVKRSCETFGKIDFLINNAGGQFPARPSEISDNGWRAVVDLNLNGTWNMCSRVSPLMVKQGSGAIVNIVHVYSFNRGAPPFVHSGAARAGVVSMTQSMSYYLARHGVTINALAPGTIDTRGVHEEEFASAEYGDLADSTLRDVPAHRMGTAEEMAAVALFLCSPAARYINGASIVADGAQFMGNWAPMVDPERY
jgi:NAD(P)-dependent dehydrogenase (short-subunit alcohol dehydrogenase family)